MPRIRRFRTETRFQSEGGKDVVIKSLSPDSADFLDAIMERERMAARLLEPKVEVLLGTRRDPVSISYPRLPHPSMSTLVERRIREGDRESARLLIASYLELLDSLPSQEMIPVEFLARMGLDPGHDFPPLPCLEFAPLDLIPQNLLTSGTRTFSIDHEWTFGFPAPREFIAFRGLLNLAFGLRDALRTTTSEAEPSSILAGFGSNRVYWPVAWSYFLRDFKLPLRVWSELNWRFQRSILIGEKLFFLRWETSPGLLPGIPHPLKALLADCLRYPLHKAAGCRWRLRERGRYLQDQEGWRTTEGF